MSFGKTGFFLMLALVACTLVKSAESDFIHYIQIHCRKIGKYDAPKDDVASIDRSIFLFERAYTIGLWKYLDVPTDALE